MAICGNCFNNIPNTGPCPICGYDSAGDAKKYPTALPVGTVLNQRFFVGRVLGQGGFGVTYLAQDYATKERIAIKEYFPIELSLRAQGSRSVQAYSDNRAENFESGKQQFLAEARTLAELIGDEHIIRIYRYFEENDTAYFAMEFAEGQALNSYLEARRELLTVDEANEIFLPLMESLANVHAKGIVHRDISPDNIIIQPDGGAKLIDFGAARYSTGEMSKSLDVILKHGFAPPEQYTRRSRQGPFTDVYALAATYYYAITGKVPPDAVDRMVDDTLVPPSKQGAKLGKNVDQVLLKALAPNYKDRYQSMTEFRDALVSACSGKSGGTIRHTAAKKNDGGAFPHTSAKAAAPKGETGKKSSAGKVAAVLAALLLLLALVFGGSRVFRSLREKGGVAAPAAEDAVPAEPGGEADDAVLNPADLIASTVYRPDAEILLAGTNVKSPCDVEDWTDIVKISAGVGVTYGIRSDGTAVATGTTSYGECQIDDWTDLVDIKGNWAHTVGLRSDGTVLATGLDVYGQRKAEDWTDIVAIAPGGWFTLGLKSDGTVVCTGDLDVGSWKDITAIAAGNNFALGLRKDGTAVAVGSNEFGQCDVSGWRNIVAIDAKGWHAVGLRKDGTVVGSGNTGGRRRDTDDWTHIESISAGYYSTVGQRTDGSLVSTGWNYYGEDEIEDWEDIIQVASGEYCTVGLRPDGTVIARGRGGNNMSPAEEWKQIAKIAVGNNFIAGLRKDGTVICAGATDNGQELVSDWTDIQDIATGDFHTVGVRKDGTVCIQGRNSIQTRQESDNWRNVTSVAAGTDYTVALRSDGTVVAAGNNGDGQCNVSDWRNIVAISASNMLTLGLRADGTVVAAGINVDGQCNVSGWKDIVAIAAGGAFSVGLRSDGTVVAVGFNNNGECNVDDWTDIVAIAAGQHHTVGLKSDGTLVATGLNYNGQCDVEDWTGVVEISAGGFYTAARRESQEPENPPAQEQAPAAEAEESEEDAAYALAYPAGSVITFGSYEQDNKASNGKEPIEWTVLDVQRGKALVISRYGLDSLCYNEEMDRTNWDTCTLRAWLNDSFLNAAFTPEEQAAIPVSMVSADKNPQYYSNPGPATQDRIFLISVSEAKAFMGSDTARVCEPTAYAKASGIVTDGGKCWWWLRTPGYSADCASYVDFDGSLYIYGSHVDNSTVVIRPAMWIDLSKLP